MHFTVGEAFSCIASSSVSTAARNPLDPEEGDEEFEDAAEQNKRQELSKAEKAKEKEVFQIVLFDYRATNSLIFCLSDQRYCGKFQSDEGSIRENFQTASVWQPNDQGFSCYLALESVAALFLASYTAGQLTFSTNCLL